MAPKESSNSCAFLRIASINPIAYEDGEAIFLDTEYDTWNTDPKALEKAIEMYPDVKLYVMVHLYGTPGKVEEIKKICDKHGILIVEDACESFGAKSYQQLLSEEKEKKPEYQEELERLRTT